MDAFSEADAVQTHNFGIFGEEFIKGTHAFEEALHVGYSGNVSRLEGLPGSSEDGVVVGGVAFGMSQGEVERNHVVASL